MSYSKLYDPTNCPAKAEFMFGSNSTNVGAPTKSLSLIPWIARASSGTEHVGLTRVSNSTVSSEETHEISTISALLSNPVVSVSNKTIGESMSCLAARMASRLSFINCSVVITSPVKASWNCIPTGCRNWEQRTVSDATPRVTIRCVRGGGCYTPFSFLHHLRVVLPVGIQPHRLTPS